MNYIIKDNIPKDVISLLKIINKDNEGYLVGGCVRDLILNKMPHDYDICTNLKPNEIINLLKEHDISFHTVGIEHGTVSAIINNEEYEITSYRMESGYSDGRRPDEVIFVDDIHKDLARRDFAINAMAYNPITEDFIDDFEGLRDLKEKKIRTVGDADSRFKEDGLRIMRALRFAITFDFKIDDKTKEAMQRHKELLNAVSKERITDEFKKIFKTKHFIRNVFLDNKSIIETLIPEIKPCVDFEQNNKYHIHDVFEHMLYVTDYCNTDDFEIKLAALLHDIGKPDCYTVDENGFGHFYEHPNRSYEICLNVLKNDFRLTNEEYENILKLIQYHDISPTNSEKSVKRVLQKMSPEIFDKWCILKQADIDDHIRFSPYLQCQWIKELKETKESILEKESCFSLKSLAINGYDIMQTFSLKQGKAIGAILNNLLNKVIDEEVENNKKDLLKEASEVISQATRQYSRDLLNGNIVPSIKNYDTIEDSVR